MAGTVRFLMDRDVDHDMVRAMRTIDAAVDVLCVGERGAPPDEIGDPELLQAAFDAGRILVSRDRSTMLKHLKDRYDEGGRTVGLILLREGIPIMRLAEELVLIWASNSAEEWVDRTVYLPM